MTRPANKTPSLETRVAAYLRPDTDGNRTSRAVTFFATDRGTHRYLVRINNPEPGETRCSQ